MNKARQMKTTLEQDHELLRQGETASAELFFRAINAAYQDPAPAILRMENYRSGKGQDALLKTLAVKPSVFGRSKHEALRGSPDRADIQLRKDVKAATVLLSIFAKDMFDARTRRVEFELRLSGAPLRFNDISPKRSNAEAPWLHSL